MLKSELNQLKELALNFDEPDGTDCCIQCNNRLDERYLVNHRADYFCSEECHDLYHETNAHKSKEHDDDHPYYFDYSTIRQQYIYWFDNWKLLLQKASKHVNEYAQWNADDFIDDIDEIIWAYKDYIVTEGDDGIFAYEIYNYTQKLMKIQCEILQWRPERQTFYGLSSESIEGRVLEEITAEICAAEGNEFRQIISDHAHQFHEYLDLIFDDFDERDIMEERLHPYFQRHKIELNSYSSHLCDGGCGDYLDAEDNDFWNDGWFYCDSCLRNKDVGELTIAELKRHLQYYLDNADDLQPIINDKQEEYVRYKSLIRRACRVHNVEIPDWAIE